MERNYVNSNSFINKIIHLLVNCIMFIPRTAKCNFTLTQTHLQHDKSTWLLLLVNKLTNLTFTNKKKSNVKECFSFRVLNSQGSKLNNVFY